MPNPDDPQSDTGSPSDTTYEPSLDVKDWVMRHLHLNDPLELRRAEIRRQAEAAGFADVDVINLGTPEFWEVRFSPRANVGCTTAAEAERWLIHIIDECQCQVEPGQFVAVVDGNRIAARFRLQQGIQHELGELF